MIKGIRKSGLYREIGRTGLSRYGGQIYAEPDYRLQGVEGARVFNEMARTSPIIAGGLFIIETIMGQVPWIVRPGGPDTQDLVAAGHFESCLYDMSTSWHQTLMEIMQMLRSGWSYLEMVYKIRRGRNQKNHMYRSNWRDGSVGWRRWSPRSPLSLQKWVYSDDGSLIGMNQLDPVSMETNFIPLEKSLLFRFRSVGDNPEGESPLRGAYGPWMNMGIVEEMMQTGLDRDLAGIPVLKVPQRVMDGKGKDAGAKSKAMSILSDLRSDDSAGVLISSSKTEGEPDWELSLLSSSGQRQFNLVQILNMYSNWIAASFLIDVLLLGTGRQGSYALADVKNRLLNTAIGSILDTVCEVVNQHAIPQLAELNPGIYGEIERLPELAHGKVEATNLSQLSEVLQRLGYKGRWEDPDSSIERQLRELADLPTESKLTVEGESVEEKEALAKAARSFRPRSIGGSVRGRAVA